MTEQEVSAATDPPTTKKRTGPGRPSMRAERRGQILEAAVGVVLEHGIAGATRARIADAADVAAPLVHHFVGTQEDVIAATVETIVTRLDGSFGDVLDNMVPAERVRQSVDLVFGSAVDAPEVNQLVDELVAHSYRSERTATLLAEFYEATAEILTSQLAAAWPDGAASWISETASQIVLLAHSAGTFRHLGLTETAAAGHRRARELVAAGPG